MLNPKLALQLTVAVLEGQALLYKAYPNEATPTLVVNVASLNRNTTVGVAAVKLYQISSLLSVVPQEGSGKECVAPVVFADMEERQVVPGGVTATVIAALQSLFIGGAGTSYTQKSKLQ